MGTSSHVATRYVFSDLIPDGRNFVRVQMEKETLLVVRPGMMDPALMHELNEDHSYAAATGMMQVSAYEPAKGHPQT